MLQQKYPFTLPPLGYANTAVVPAADASTLAAHHDKLHAAHVTALNAAMEKFPALQEYSLGQLLMGLRRWPAEARPLIREHGSAHASHALYWKLIAPGAPTAATPSGRLGGMLTREFETLEKCLAELKATALGIEGNGWAWMVKTATNRLALRVMTNEDSPLIEAELPILGIDMWEHAYSRLYQTKREAYVDAVLSRINWDVAGAQVE
ncbi:MAG: superoxide dismutase [Gemmatimonadaceae bacterium]|nr:superoxide dismutase [Gemmatimonadaceae bacterium]